MSHPGLPTDEQQDSAAEAFYVVDEPKCPRCYGTGYILSVTCDECLDCQDKCPDCHGRGRRTVGALPSDEQQL
jgi:DnaJ-class molecular chaperone